jgi:hypothetical protein
MSIKYSGADWIRENWSRDGRQMSELGEHVANILGQAYLGIYHIENEVLNNRVDWSNTFFIRVVIRGGLYSFDDDVLTRLIVLCHDQMIRLGINSCAPRCLGLIFHQRTSRVGRIEHRMPTMEDHISLIRESIGLPILEEAQS